jgi:hypothetical protein
VAGGDHRDARHVQLELSEVRHRRQREPDVVDFGAAGEQPGDQRLLHRRGVGTVVVADDEAQRHFATAEQLGDPEADGIEAHQVDFLREQPARIVLAETGRLDQRQALELGGVGFQIGARLRQHHWAFPCRERAVPALVARERTPGSPLGSGPT